MKLQTLNLRWVKGIRELPVEAGGKDLDVYGANGLGKTTIADSLCWLWFDKDSLDRDGRIMKPIDTKTGEDVHNVNTEVEAVFDLGSGQSLELKKRFYEKWEQKQGTNEKKFTGHSTDYWAGGVKMLKKDYDAVIAGLCEPKRFRMLVDPYYFCAVLPWAERRRVLLDMAGEITDADVIASDKRLAPLPAILEGRSAEQHKKRVGELQKEINSELRSVPDRIDELKRSIDEAAAETDLAPLENAVAGLEERRAALATGGALPGIAKRLAEVESEMAAIETKARQDHQAAVDAHGAEYRRLTQLWTDRSTERSQAEARLNALSNAFARMLDDYNRLKAEQFDDPGECPTCGQRIPEESQAAAREAWNTAHAHKLEDNLAKGKEAKAAKKSAQVEYETATTAMIAAKDAIDAHSATAHNAAPSYGIRFDDLGIEKRDLDHQKEEASKGNAPDLAAIDQSIASARHDLRQAQEANAAVAASAKAAARVAELEEKENKLAADHQKLSGEAYLCELFVRAKCAMLTDKINARFEIVTWKLFEEQVNEGIKECCEAMLDNKPYPTLSSSEKINAGLDVINTLAAAFGFAPPVFIDNAESNTSIRPTKGQQIRLRVSEQDKKLRTVN